MTRWYSAPTARAWNSPAISDAAEQYHRQLRGYAVTPLIDLPDLATELKVGRVLIKDESSRLGLPAFKILGASWACHQVHARQPGATLVTATDGNHGRAVARTAKNLGVPAVVFVPEVMLTETAALIEGEGADVIRVHGNYDASVRLAEQYAAGHAGHALVQDTSWPGYEQVPACIIEGYQTLVREVDTQLGARPDLVVVPVGVGSLAEAVVRHYRQPDTSHPRVLSVEPDTAACVVTSLQTKQPVTVQTAGTVMAGLNCGTVSKTAWPVLRDGCDHAIDVTDADALQAVADLEHLGVSSGACGAATLAGVRAALSDPHRRHDLHLVPDAVVVLLSTEGNHR